MRRLFKWRHMGKAIGRISQLPQIPSPPYNLPHLETRLRAFPCHAYSLLMLFTLLLWYLRGNFSLYTQYRVTMKLLYTCSSQALRTPTLKCWISFAIPTCTIRKQIQLIPCTIPFWHVMLPFRRYPVNTFKYPPYTSLPMKAVKCIPEEERHKAICPRVNAKRTFSMATL